jgi:hypothetical protein
MSNDIEQQPANGQMVVREEFNAKEAMARAETAAVAVAAQARATVEARYVLALKRPRDWMEVRNKLLQACKRPGFAATARYHKPIGDGVEGPSIRFAEEALRAMTNVLPESVVVYDDREKRILRVQVTDLENNVTYSSDVTVHKSVERSKPAKGARILGTRTNSKGYPVYLVEATEDDILNKQNAIISKAIRTNGLRLLPGDILEEAMAQAIATCQAADTKDPTAASKAIADAFAGMSITPAMLRDYLGHGLDTCTPGELGKLRGLFAAIRDGQSSWAEAMDSVEQQKEQAKEGSKDEPKGGLKDKLKAQETKGEQPPKEN